MKAIFSVPVANANAVLPPMEELHYIEDDVLTGGYSLIGQVPQARVPTCLVLIDSSPETIRAMYEDPAYLWMENLPEPEEGHLDMEDAYYWPIPDPLADSEEVPVE